MEIIRCSQTMMKYRWNSLELGATVILTWLQVGLLYDKVMYFLSKVVTMAGLILIKMPTKSENFVMNYSKLIQLLSMQLAF